MRHWTIKCPVCKVDFKTVDSGICGACGTRLVVSYAASSRQRESNTLSGRGLWRYRHLLPVSDDLTPITMGEGDTPLVRSCWIGPSVGFKELYFKLEFCNPTGSFKDRIASLMVSRWASEGVSTLLCITSGNAGSAIAAYGTRAGLRSIILYLAEAPPSKSLQMHAYGASVLVLEGISESPGNLNRVFSDMFALGRSHNWGVVVMSHRFDPINVEAYKTIAFEICDELQTSRPDVLYSPVGGGGLFAAIWKGFGEHDTSRYEPYKPRMIAVQPAGAASVAAGIADGKDDAVPVPVNSRISGVSAPHSSDGNLVIKAIKETGGHCSCPTDDEIYQAQSQLAEKEGLFAEPAGAVAVAGFIKDASEGRIDTNNRVVCIVSASGFKDSEAATRLFMNQSIKTIRFDELDRIAGLVGV